MKKHWSWGWIAMLAVGWTVCGTAYGQAEGAPGQISGTVFGDDGAPLGGIFVTYVRTQFESKDTVPASGGMTTDASGSYSFSSLIPGVYTLCGYAPPSRALVQDCEWNPQQPQVSLAAGQSVKGNTIVMHMGVRLHIQVADPQELAPVKDWTAGPSGLSPGVWSPDGLFHPAHIRSGGAGQIEYILVVPAQTALTPYIEGANLLFSVNTGIGILGTVNSSASSLTGSLARGDQTITFQITGTASTSVVAATPTATKNTKRNGR